MGSASDLPRFNQPPTSWSASASSTNCGCCPPIARLTRWPTTPDRLLHAACKVLSQAPAARPSARACWPPYAPARHRRARVDHHPERPGCPSVDRADATRRTGRDGRDWRRRQRRPSGSPDPGQLRCTTPPALVDYKEELAATARQQDAELTVGQPVVIARIARPAMNRLASPNASGARELLVDDVATRPAAASG